MSNTPRVQHRQRLGLGKSQLSIVVEDELVEALDTLANEDNRTSVATVTRADKARQALRLGLAQLAAHRK